MKGLGFRDSGLWWFWLKASLNPKTLNPKPELAFRSSRSEFGDLGGLGFRPGLKNLFRVSGLGFGV